MFRFLREPLPPRTRNTANNPVIYENGRSSVEFHAPGSDFIMTHTIPPTTTEHGASIIQPPFHYHMYQSEVFRVRSGIGHFYRGLDTKPFAILSSEAGAQTTASVPARRYHRFENASKTDDLVVDIQLDPEAYANEERFFRNFFGYLDDCKKDGSAPSLFQLLVFLHSADTPLALPLPIEAVGLFVSRIFMVLVAIWGTYVLGYQANYPEYYDGGKSK